MVQWFHVYEMHDGIVDLVLRTFGSVFPSMEIWDSGGGDIILVGSDRPWDNSLEHLRIAFAREPVRKDLAAIGIDSPEAFLAGNSLRSGRICHSGTRASAVGYFSRFDMKLRWRFSSAPPPPVSRVSMSEPGIRLRLA